MNPTAERPDSDAASHLSQDRPLVPTDTYDELLHLTDRDKILELFAEARATDTLRPVKEYVLNLLQVNRLGNPPLNITDLWGTLAQGSLTFADPKLAAERDEAKRLVADLIEKRREDRHFRWLGPLGLTLARMYITEDQFQEAEDILRPLLPKLSTEFGLDDWRVRFCYSRLLRVTFHQLKWDEVWILLRQAPLIYSFASPSLCQEELREICAFGLFLTHMPEYADPMSTSQI